MSGVSPARDIVVPMDYLAGMLRCSTLHRRQFLNVSLGGLAGVTLPTLLRAEDRRRTGLQPVPGTQQVENPPSLQPRAKACILLYMDGGPSQLDLWDLKPDAPAEIRGPCRPLATSVPGLYIGEHLPLVARQMHRATLLRSMRHAETVHDPAVYQMLTGWKHASSAGGLKVESTDAPHMAASFGYADRAAGVMPKVIQLPETMKMEGRVLPGQSAGYLGRAFDPFRVEVSSDGQVDKPELALRPGIDADRVGRLGALLDRLNGPLCRLEETTGLSYFDTYQRQALAILARPSVDAAFDLEQEPRETRDHYGRHRHGQSVLLARRLVEAGARFVTVYWGKELQDWADGRPPRLANNPWDTHRNHFPLVKETLCPPADRAFAALLADLDGRGLLAETLVVWMGDFGRTPRISKPWASRDHWPGAFSIVLAGAGLPQGAVVGATDPHAADVADQPITPADLTATIYHLLGVDPHTAIPGSEGGPHPLSAGHVIAGLA